MEKYRGNCHCGAVTFNFSLPKIEQAMRCDCSICARKGIVMTADFMPPESIEIEAKEGALSTYQFGTMTARHHFCNQCGIHTFVETRRMPGHYRVNLGCVEGLDALRIPEIIFDGKSI